MRLGLELPHLGPLATPLATPHAIRTVAIAAESAGVDSSWAMDRLLSPVAPRTFAYPGRTDGTLPTAQQTVIDPLVALTAIRGSASTPPRANASRSPEAVGK